MNLNGKTILITGGTGSFGQTVVTDLLSRFDCRILIFSRDEKKQDELRRTIGDERVTFWIGDVRDSSSVRGAMRGTDFVFHAAALKQVPSCEFFPIEAVKTNVIGTQNVIEEAITAGVEKVVCLSTDKAVYPINAMGVSKAMMEKVALSFARRQSNTKVCVTRYGNVMGSRGSVIPLFVKQIRSGKPLTITNGNMTRFLMNLNEAAHLVYYAFEHAESGDTIVQKSPASTIDTLAKAIMKIEGVNAEICTIGTRHGEKMHETLLSREEFSKAEDKGYYFSVPMDARDLNYSNFVSLGKENVNLDQEYNSVNTKRLDVDQTIDVVRPVIDQGFFE